jgi:hypothetical protein
MVAQDPWCEVFREKSTSYRGSAFFRCTTTGSGLSTPDTSDRYPEHSDRYSEWLSERLPGVVAALGRFLLPTATDLLLEYWRLNSSPRDHCCVPYAGSCTTEGSSVPDYEAMMKRAGTKPCPWCGKTGTLTPRGAAQNAILPLKGFLYGVLHAARDPKDFLKNGITGLPVMCGRCEENVCICPHCDTPNRTLGRMRNCTDCGRQFTVG